MCDMPADRIKNTLVLRLWPASEDNGNWTSELSFSQPHIRQDYPLNLSISLSGGKENKCDSPSNGE
jgi:hypothetical protein